MKRYSINIEQTPGSDQVNVDILINDMVIFSFHLSATMMDRRSQRFAKLIGQLSLEWCHSNSPDAEAKRLQHCKDLYEQEFTSEATGLPWI